MPGVEFERSRRPEQRSDSSKASIQHLPAAWLGARNIKYAVGKGCVTAPKIAWKKCILIEIEVHFYLIFTRL